MDNFFLTIIQRKSMNKSNNTFVYQKLLDDLESSLNKKSIEDLKIDNFMDFNITYDKKLYEEARIIISSLNQKEYYKKPYFYSSLIKFIKPKILPHQYKELKGFIVKNKDFSLELDHEDEEIKKLVFVNLKQNKPNCIKGFLRAAIKEEPVINNVV